MSKYATTIACIDALVATLKASSTLSALFQAHENRALTIFIGYDEMKLPPMTSAPYLVLMPGAYGRNSDQSGRTHAVQIALLIDNESVTTTSGVIRFAGLETSEILSQAIDTALEAWIAANFLDGYTKGLYQTSIAPPAIKTVWSYEFQDQI